ncbi:MAG: hypothetical protein Q9201_000451 [Fulgogasparrea decipioides]
MPPSKSAYDIDWVFSNNSNVHVANHRDWFTSYTPFATTFVHIYTGRPTEVLGPVSLDRKCEFRSGPGVAKITDTTTGARIGLFDRSRKSRLLRLRLRGQSAKQTSLKPDPIYIINANWASSERARWHAFKWHKSQEGMASCINAIDANMPLTQLEKSWTKDHYRNEFHFLRDYGLSIYKDEDREEGRRILRALMSDGSTNNDGDNAEDDGRSDEVSVNSFQRDLEEDPSSHAADYHFTANELDWISKSYGHSANFLRSYGLQFSDEEDCQESKAIIRALLEEEVLQKLWWTTAIHAESSASGKNHRL